MKEDKRILDYRETIENKIQNRESIEDFVFSIDDIDVGVLEISVYLEDEITCKRLLELGLNPNGKEGLDDITPLMLAAQANNLNLINLLIKYRADTNQTDSFGITPLMIATINKNTKMIKSLLIAGANMYQEDFYGQSAYSISANLDDQNMKDIYNHSTIKDKDYSNSYSNFLFSLIEVRDMQSIKTAIENNNDLIKVKNNQGKTAFHIAVEHDYLEIIPYLISKGGDYQEKDNQGNTIDNLNYQCLYLSDHRQHVLKALLEVNTLEKEKKLTVDTDKPFIEQKKMRFH